MNLLVNVDGRSQSWCRSFLIASISVLWHLIHSEEHTQYIRHCRSGAVTNEHSVRCHVSFLTDNVSDRTIDFQLYAYVSACT